MALRSPHRRGMIASVVALLLASSAAVVAAGLAAHAATRRVEVADRIARAQAREWCLGAAALGPGAELVVGRWRVVHAADGSRSASGPRGAYRIMPDGSERWSAGSRR